MARVSKKYVFFSSFVLTCLIFIIGYIVNYNLDFWRYDKIQETIEIQELGTQNYYLEKSFINIIGEDHCQVITRRLNALKSEIRNIGNDLTNYGKGTIFKKKDFDYLKRKYFLLELNLYNLIMTQNEKCGMTTIPIMFFYDIDHGDCTTQGYILEDMSLDDEFKEKIVVLSFDIEYEDENALNLLKRKYDIKKAPTIIINGEDIIDGLVPETRINQTIQKHLNRIYIDRYSAPYDMNYTLKATGINITRFIERYQRLLDSDKITEFARADILLMLGRVTGNDTMICSALAHYDNAHKGDTEESALIYETIASIDCGRNKKAFYLEASESWKQAGNDFRARIARSLAYRNDMDLNVNPSKIRSPVLINPKNSTAFMIGESMITLDRDSTIVAQVDRVTRDWLGITLNQSPIVNSTTEILKVFSERWDYTEDELMADIGWHEGGRINDLLEVDPAVMAAAGTLVYRHEGVWYAPDERGVFRFEVPQDKVFYPTTRFHSEDLATIIDTHGMNSIVEQALRYNATAAIACCDNPSKIAAAQHLSKKGISAICFTDKYLPMILGSNESILGSPPQNITDKQAILGNRPILFSFEEKFLVQDASSGKFATSYYKTPKYYFTNLEKAIDLDVTYFSITDFNMTRLMVDKALDINATVIAARCFNRQDYIHLKRFLDEDVDNRLILFHSSAYPYGVRLFEEYPRRTTFDDINIRFI